MATYSKKKRVDLEQKESDSSDDNEEIVNDDIEDDGDDGDDSSEEEINEPTTDEEYFLALEREVNEERKKREKGGQKTVVTHKKDSAMRRSCYSRRARTLLKNAKEIAVETRCSVSLAIRPTWQKGKSWCFSTPDADSTQSRLESGKDHEKERDIATPSSMSTSTKRHATVNASEPSSGKVNKDNCRVCNCSEDIDLWIGCSFTQRSKASCQYWVHQKCIGLAYRSEKELEAVPYFCPRHIKYI